MMATGEIPRLIIISGPAAGEVFVLVHDEMVLGRDSGNAIAIGDPSLSRKHCTVERTAVGWNVRDLGSFNGTFVGGERVSTCVLTHGDRIRIGATELLFHAEPSVRHSDQAVTELPDTTSLRLDDGVTKPTALA